MNFEVFRSLKQIEEKFTESRKIIEKLLAISFDRARGGFEVDSKSTEGVDICLVREQERYAVEVKTTTGSSVAIEEKDVKGLRDKAHRDGYTPVIAVLRIRLLEEWVVARATRLVPGEYTPCRLSLDSIPKLEGIAKTQFEKTLLELVKQVLNPPKGSPLEFLSNLLAQENKLC